MMDQNAASVDYRMTMSQCDPSDMYANRDVLVSHYVTMRRPQLLPNGDIKPPRPAHSRGRPPPRPPINSLNAAPPDPTIVGGDGTLLMKSADPCMTLRFRPPPPLDCHD